MTIICILLTLLIVSPPFVEGTVGYRRKGNVKEKVCELKKITEKLVARNPARRSLLDDRNLPEFTWKSVMHELRSCTTFVGDLIIDHKSFKDKREGENVGMDDLMALTKLRRINGSVSLYLKYYTNVTTLYFLENLKEINAPHGVFGLYWSKVEALNLTGVTFNVEEVKILENHNLCFMENFNSNVMKTTKVSVAKNRNGADCFAEKKICDSACRSACLGPGSRRCADCLKVRAGEECVLSCRDRRGFYQGGTSGDCSRCHPQCGWSCSGPGPHQCDFCRAAQDGRNCVSRCPDNKYLEEDSKQCRDCLWIPTANCRSECEGRKESDCGPCQRMKMLWRDINRSWSCLDHCPNGYERRWSRRGEGYFCKKMVVNIWRAAFIAAVVTAAALLMALMVLCVRSSCKRRRTQQKPAFNFMDAQRDESCIHSAMTMSSCA